MDEKCPFSHSLVSAASINELKFQALMFFIGVSLTAVMMLESTFVPPRGESVPSMKA